MTLMNAIFIALGLFFVAIPSVLLPLIKKDKGERKKQNNKNIGEIQVISGQSVSKPYNNDSQWSELTSDNIITSLNNYYVCSEDKTDNFLYGLNKTNIGGRECIFLDGGNTVFGRGADVDVVIRDPSVSRRHFSIRINNESAFIIDLGSTNGTYLNEQRVVEALKMFPGDQIKAGSVKIDFLKCEIEK